MLSDDLTKICVAELTLGIQFLHSKRIVHRDLKPENILIDNAGHIMISDFDLAQKIPSHEKLYHRCGTLAYMAPGE